MAMAMEIQTFEAMDLGVALFVLGISWITLSLLIGRIRSSQQRRLPPGPFSFPIFGALFSLEEPLHQHFAKISKKYGPIVYLKIGMAPFVVVSNNEMAAQVLKTHDLEFASRPDDEFFRIISHDWNDLILGPIGDKWKTMRRICSTHLFSNSMLKTSAGFRESEMKHTVKSIFQQSETTINLQEVFSSLLSNSLCLVLFSERGLEVMDLSQKISSLSLHLNIGALLPALDGLDLHGVYKKLNRELMPRLKLLLEDQIDKHRRRKDQAGDGFVPRDFTDVLISLEDKDKLPDISILALLWDMVVAGLETSLVTLEWTMAELINHPRVVSKTQDELDSVVGRARAVQESDLPNLPYIDAIVKESLRLHPAAPLGVPHKNLKPVNLGGYTIPAGCKVLVNIWAIGRDPARWSDPGTFQPERFLGSSSAINGQNFDFIPFSSGRRVCAGYPLAMRSIAFYVASLLQAFNWRPANPGGIDMEERTRSITMKLDADLLVNASIRLDQNIICS
ncbi:flavonoid 3'-monooxygenase-like [Selaginella moellendorffii]|uniref:flavonoid 3'-monooxygenase-like n=1 Tax=Selaginella moellendorffii TaxID=88036 RepID=UPI000D1CE8B0|nr:flavonoid 3'-monooxygenase-like [Selaginella moellendorffii]|eukprot:XP_024527059.1 flavonoid 3'-monooxygenase-like [Selaginella moellendorffii]